MILIDSRNPWGRPIGWFSWFHYESALIDDPDPIVPGGRAVVCEQLGDQFYTRFVEPELPRLVVVPGSRRGSALVVDVEAQQVVAGPMSVSEACVVATRRVR